MFYRWVRYFLFLLPPETAHHVTLRTLRWLYRWHLLPRQDHSAPQLARQIWGLHFPNPIGLAAGLDKNGEYIDALSALGFGFIEVGTVTPRPQPGNPKPRLFRLVPQQALINRMGFNNKGVDYLLEQLQKTQYRGILGINIGKNFDTPNEQAHEDYLIGLRKVYSYASYIVINVSSPNTQGLRALQHGEALRQLLQLLHAERELLQQATGKRVPLLVKIAPDLSTDEIQDMAAIFRAQQIDGVIATNTTFSRTGVSDHPAAQQTGGMSGAPLAALASTTLATLRQALPAEVPIIGVGGIDSAAAAKEKLAQGATLLQLYTGLIYQGPGLVKQLLRALAK